MIKKLKRNLILSILGVGSLWAQASSAQDFGLDSLQLGLNGILPTNTGDPREMIGRLIAIALGFLGVLAVGLILYAGLKWMTSNGNQEKVDDAKRILKNSVIGLVIIMASWAIAAFVISRLGGAIGGSNPGMSCVDNATRACGCGNTGIQTCFNEQWGNCFGEDPGCGAIIGGASCSNSATTCEPNEEICGESNYCDISCHCRPKALVGDPCDADINTPTCEVSNNICGAFLSCNSETCTCEGSPVITGISPTGVCAGDSEITCSSDTDCPSGTCSIATPNGAPNNLVTISGHNFGAFQEGTSTVLFGDKPGSKPQTINNNCLDTWTDKQIVIVVPAGVITSPITVINSEGKQDKTNDNLGPLIPDFIANNISRPGLCSLAPLSGKLKDIVNYQGINLANGEIKFGSYQSGVSSPRQQLVADDFSATTTVPSINPGLVSSFIVKDNVFSNYLKFTKDAEPEAGPFISSFSPESGPSNQYVTINGGGFGSVKGNSQVFFGNESANYAFPAICLNSVWKNDQIIVKVPTTLGEGNYTIKVRINDENISAAKEFTVNVLPLNPSLCKIEPTRGVASTTVVAWGEYFGTNSASLRFTRNKDVNSAIGNEGSAQKIIVSVPNGSITGPVSVIKNNQSGNSLNFFVGACTENSDCGGQVCCPSSTYKKGRCVNALNECLIDIPNSVFEWKFSTGYATTTINPNAYSCAGLASYFGKCDTGACPNVPGSCSPYAGGQERITGECDSGCNNIAGCEGSSCLYNTDLNKCVKSGDCSLPKLIPYSISGITGTTTATCNVEGKWEITLQSSCPVGWEMRPGNKCVETNGSCELCSGAALTCQKIGTEGKCTSAAICSDNSTCQSSGQNINKCVFKDQKTCDCCCTKGQDARDCCGGLTCEGSCGSNVDRDSGVGTFGKCGGCALAGTTPEERDAACNCSGHSGQFCEVNDPGFPEGVCTDCSSLNSLDCTSHSSACCMDSMKTATTTDDVCLGVNGRELVSRNFGDLGYGYCAYYNCQTAAAGDPNKCASTTPVISGDYNNVNNCGENCAQADPCSGLGSNFSACNANSRCCFDNKNTAQPTCRLAGNGDRITNGADAGYCAYYNCDSRNPFICASSTPVTTNGYKLADCVSRCAYPLTGPGLKCVSGATSTCDTNRCNFPGFGCLNPLGLSGGGQSEDCGTCCCQPTNNPGEDACTVNNPKLKCLANKGSCSGANRGLCCGCSSDDECGSTGEVGCGTDTCCQQRPKLNETSPAHLANNVCRNAAIKIDFNMPLDLSSLNNNVLLLEEREFSAGQCPEGTNFVLADELMIPTKVSWFDKTIAQIIDWWALLGNRLTGRVLAAVVPDNNKFYCSVSGIVSGEKRGEEYSIYFTPQKLMSPGARYYVVVKGDEVLNSQTGVLSVSKIGFNGEGYPDGGGTFREGDEFKFNNQSYPNSRIFTFKTLSDQATNNGVCLIDSVDVSPNSYLFKTTDNDLNEKDDNTQLLSFDTIADKDKVFAAFAYSADRQILRPVDGYRWNWNFTISNRSVISTSSVNNLELNKIFVSAQSGVTDGESSVKAKVNMAGFSNISSMGDGLSYVAGVNVFICNNPWPPIMAGGTWSPYKDSCDASAGCFNYKFYYCRDAGEPGTLDDLPAIINQSKNVPGSLICSSNGNACSGADSPCGTPENPGICSWKVLKESYFFREAILSGVNITEVKDTKSGGEVSLKWNKSESSDTKSYKIYYLKTGSRDMLNKEVASSSCNTNCSAIITGLENNKSYAFKISVISKNKTESALSAEKIVTPTDKTPPLSPTNFKIATTSTKIIFKWNNSLDTKFARLYRGVTSGQYGQSFDSQLKATSTSVLTNAFTVGRHYFNLKVLDVYNNESVFGGEMRCDISKKTGCANLGEPNCLNLACCSLNCNNACGNAAINECGEPCSCPEGFDCLNERCCAEGDSSCAAPV